MGDQVKFEMLSKTDIRATVIRTGQETEHAADESNSSNAADGPLAEETLAEMFEAELTTLSVEQRKRVVRMLHDFTAEMHGKGGGDGLIADVKHFLRELSRREERWTEAREGVEYKCPQNAADFAKQYKAWKAEGVLNHNLKSNTDAEWRIIYVPSGACEHTTYCVSTELTVHCDRPCGL